MVWSAAGNWLGGRARFAAGHPHFGEERPPVGRGGSGTIFFGHCNLLCVFCQNWEISHRGDGSEMNDEGLAALRIGLQKAGCHNISLATPTHVVPSIVGALRVAIVRGLRVPLVYNCGGYEAEEIVKLLDGIVDIYLPDFKFADSAVAEKYCGGARDYAERAAAAILEMHRQVGDLVVDEKGIALRGLMIRHLVLPGNIATHDMPMSTSLRSVAVLSVLLKYASGRRPSRASYPRASPAPHDDGV